MPHFRWPTYACTAFCLLVLIVAALDLSHTRSEVPPVPAANCGTDFACNEARNDRIEQRRLANVSREDQYRSRAWIYALAIIAAIGLATAASMRSRERNRWPRVFTNLGMAGVASGIAATVLLTATSDVEVEAPTLPAYAPALAVLLAAAIGTVVGRARRWAQTDGQAEVEPEGIRIAARTLVWTALALTAAVVVLVLVFMSGQPACGGDGGTAPGWTDPVGLLAGIAGLAAMASAIGALTLRRWLVALIVLVVSPSALLVMIASTCAFY